MKTLTIALLVIGSFASVAQAQMLAKATNTTPKTATRKVNSFYARAIDKPTYVVDLENAEAKRPVPPAKTVAEIKAFPNPFTTQIDVFITDGHMAKSEYRASLYDVNGKKVYTELLTSNQHSLYLSHLSTGVYFLYIEKNGVTIKQEKFVKE